jgi:hypothetical protein
MRLAILQEMHVVCFSVVETDTLQESVNIEHLGATMIIPQGETTIREDLVIPLGMKITTIKGSKITLLEEIITIIRNLVILREETIPGDMIIRQEEELTNLKQGMLIPLKTTIRQGVMEVTSTDLILMREVMKDIMNDL